MGAGLIGDRVAIEEQDHETLIRYGFKQVRRLQHGQLTGDRVL